jgi:hypothetical protein
MRSVAAEYPGRPKHVILLTTLLTDKLVVFWLPCTIPLCYTHNGNASTQEDNIKIHLRTKEWTFFIYLVQENGQWWALVHIAMKFWASQIAENFLISWENLSCWRGALLHDVSKSHATGIQAVASSTLNRMSLLQWIMSFIVFIIVSWNNRIILRTCGSLLPTCLTTRSTNITNPIRS